MKKSILGGVTWWVALWLWITAGAVFAAEDPHKLVRATAENVLAEVSAKKTELEKDPSGIYALVQSKVVPYFDFQRMSRSAVGRFWLNASDDQKKRLTREFQELLVRTYAVALLNYSDQKIEYPPSRVQEHAEKVMIPTRVVTQGAPPIPINYRLHRKDGNWQVFDVVIDGVSLVITYRKDFTRKILKGGIEGLIGQLAERNAQLRG